MVCVKMTASKMLVAITAVLTLFFVAAMTGCSSTKALYQKEVAAALAASDPPGLGDRVRAEEVEILPAPVAAYLRRAGVVGQPRVRSLRAQLKGRIKTSEDGRWLPFQAEQHSTLGADYARYFYLKGTMLGVIPVYGRDKYERGSGEMLIRPLDLFTAAEVSGPEMARSALVTMLNDLFMAPAAMLDERIMWEAVSDTSARATLVDDSLRVSGVFIFDDDRDLVDFYTDDRTYDDGRGTSQRARWWTPLSRHRVVNGVRMPTFGRATWDFGDRTYTYVEMEVIDVEYNVGDLQQHVAGRAPARTMEAQGGS